ncbi:putative magnesium transporter NIPA3 [Capsicum chinense]|nr:putative magnesium transporter NIPA3 [Capsicum chinense]
MTSKLVGVSTTQNWKDMYRSMPYDNIKGLILALSSSVFIGASFIVKKKGLKRASAFGVRANSGVFRAMVFANTVEAVESIAKILTRAELEYFCYHSDSSLEEHTKNLLDFQQEGVFVRTDAATRDIDITNMSHVIQERTKNLLDFQQEGGVFVCKDAAARGIDIPNVSHVIQVFGLDKHYWFISAYSEEDLRRIPALHGLEYPSKTELDSQEF